MSSLGSLVVSLAMNTAEFTAGTDRATFTAAKAAASIDRSFRDAENSVTNAMKGVAVALVAGFTITALKDTFDDLVKFRSALEKMSEVTGASVASLSILGQGARLAGTDMGTVEAAIVKMVKGLSEADPASKNAGRALEYLGVSSRTASGQLKDPGEIMLDIAKKMGQMEDGANKTAIATVLWGKAGAQMLPTLKALAENGDLVSKVSAQQAKESENYERALVRLSAAQSVVGKTILGEMIVPMTTLIQMMTQAVTSTESLGYAVKGLSRSGELTTWAEKAGGAIASVVDFALLLKNTFLALGSSVAVVFSDIATVALAPLALLTGNLGSLLDLRNSVLEKANANWATLLDQNTNKTRETYEEQLKINKLIAQAQAGSFDDQVTRATNAAKRLEAVFVINDPKDKKDKIDALQKAYDQEILSLEQKGDQLAKHLELGRALTESEKAYANLLAGRYDKYSEMQKEELKQQILFNKSKEEEIRLIAVAVSMLDQYLKGTEAVNAVREKSLSLARDMESSVADSIAQAKFDLEMIGKSQIEIAKLTEIRKIDLQIRKQLEALPTDEFGVYDVDAFNRILAAGKAAKDALPIYIEQTAALKQQISLWDSVSSHAGNFFADLILNGKSAFDSLKSALKSFAAEILAFFAKKYVLEMIAGGAFGASTTAATAATGLLNTQNSSVLGTVVSGASSWLGSAAGGGAVTGGFTSGIAAGWAGSPYAGAGALADLGGIVGQAANFLVTNPIGWIALAAIAAYAVFAQKAGGPKTSGTGVATVGTDGTVSSGVNADGERFYNTDDKSLDAMVQKIVTATATSFAELLKRFGGTSGTVKFTESTDTDPKGTASNRVAQQVFVDGVKIFQQTMENLGRDGAKVGPELQLQAERALVAALKASKLPDDMAKLFAGVAAETLTQPEFDALMKRAMDLQIVLDVVATKTLPGFSVAVAVAMKGSAETIGQTAVRVGNQWLALNNVFASSDDKITSAQTAIQGAFDSIGVGVPASADAFKALIGSVDLSTESGRKLFDVLSLVAPTFKLVSDAAGVALNNLNAAIGSRNTAFARQTTLDERNSVARDFATATGQTFGEELLAQMALSPETFKGLSIESEKLLTKFLGLQTTLENYDKQVNKSGSTNAVISGGSVSGPPPPPGSVWDGSQWIQPGGNTRGGPAVVTPTAPPVVLPPTVPVVPLTTATAVSTDPHTAAIQQVQAQVAQLESFLARAADNTKRTADILLRVTNNGNSIFTTVAT